MKKILLCAMLAACTMTSAHAATDYFRLHCHTKYDSKGPTDFGDAKVVGTNKIAYVRLVDSYPNAEAFEFTYKGQTLNEVGESRYYTQDTSSGSMVLSKDNSTVTFINGSSTYFITYECGV